MFFKVRKSNYPANSFFIFIVNITVLLVGIYFSSTVYALNEESPKEPINGKQLEQAEVQKDLLSKTSSNAIYQFISSHEYLFAPLSGAIAGEVRCGAWCAAAGGALGALDEVSVYLGITDKHYLTWGVFGIATGHVLKPSMISDAAGSAAGILLPTGILNDHTEVVAPIVSAIAGSSMTGAPGLMSGLAFGTFDEVAIHSGLTDKHYATFNTVGRAATNLLGCFSPTVAEFIGTILGSVAAEYEDKISASLTAPLNTTKNLYDTYSKFIPEEQLNTHLEKHALALVGSQFMVQFLTSKSATFRQNLNYNFERLDVPNGPAWGNFQSGLVNFAIFLFPYVIGQTVSNRVDDYFCKKLQYSLEDGIRSELFSGETALRLSHDKNTTVSMDNLKSDLSTIVESGSGLITGAVSASIGGVYGVGVIVVTSPNLFVYSSLYSQAQLFIANILAKQQRAYREKITALDSNLMSIMKHDTENIRTITERDGVEFTKMRLQTLNEISREHEANRNLWSSVNSLWWSMSGLADHIFNYYLVGNEINRGRIPFESRSRVQTASWQVSDLLSWFGHNAQEVSSIDQSLDRIMVLEGKIHLHPGSASQIDKIERVTREGNQLVLQDLEVGVGDRVLVTVKELKLDMGKTYAITGETGCGKTSLLSKIKGIKENGITGRGYIYYPRINGRDPKTVMLSQQDYFPIDSSLYEVLLYPEVISKDSVLGKQKRAELFALLKEIGLHAFNADVTKVNSNETNSNTKQALDLDSKKDWYTLLSGGEKKKVMLVSAVIKKPDILILDEIFNGLDQNSTTIIQQMLKKYLPKALILVVDHHAQDNNYDGFYDNELKFFNKDVFIQNISTNTQ